jgi:hypothetical protein
MDESNNETLPHDDSEELGPPPPLPPCSIIRSEGTDPSKEPSRPPPLPECNSMFVPSLGSAEYYRSKPIKAQCVNEPWSRNLPSDLKSINGLELEKSKLQTSVLRYQVEGFNRDQRVHDVHQYDRVRTPFGPKGQIPPNIASTDGRSSVLRPYARYPSLPSDRAFSRPVPNGSVLPFSNVRPSISTPFATSNLPSENLQAAEGLMAISRVDSPGMDRRPLLDSTAMNSILNGNDGYNVCLPSDFLPVKRENIKNSIAEKNWEFANHFDRSLPHTLPTEEEKKSFVNKLTEFYDKAYDVLSHKLLCRSNVRALKHNFNFFHILIDNLAFLPTLFFCVY